jgi:hypothetical protein
MTRWTLGEAEPFYAEFLSVTYKPENFPQRGGKAALSSQYAMAASGLMAYGVRGAKYAEMLKARLAELGSDPDGDARNTAVILGEAIPIVEGRVNPKPITNYKGQLLGISQVAWPEWQAAHRESTTREDQSPKFSPPPLGPRSVCDTEQSSEVSSTSRPLWHWIGLVTLLTITSLFVWLRKR